jgi:hypothetical protein
MEPGAQHTRDVFAGILVPCAAIDPVTGWLAIKTYSKIDRDNFLIKTWRHILPAPFIHIQLNQIYAIKSSQHEQVLVSQTGRHHPAGWSPRSIKFDKHMLAERGGLWGLLLELFDQFTPTRVQPHLRQAQAQLWYAGGRQGWRPNQQSGWECAGAS